MEPPDKGAGGSRYPKKVNQKKGKFSSLSEFPVVGSSSQDKPNPKLTAKDILKKEIIYAKKLITEKILSVSLEDVQWKHDPWHIKERYLGVQNYPIQDGKHRYIYEAILNETESVQMVHHHLNLKDSKSPITHSKCYIVRVLH